MASTQMTAVKAAEQEVQKAKRAWQDKKDELKQARQEYEGQIDGLQELIRGDDAPLFAEESESDAA